jgi:hypothetical protein
MMPIECFGVGVFLAFEMQRSTFLAIPMKPIKTTTIVLCLLFSLSARASDPIRPDPKKTPGAVFNNVTIEQITQKGYANVLNGGVRHVPDKVRRAVYIAYFGSVPETGHGGARGERRSGDYEVDHLISLELGGSNEAANLWPQSYLTHPWNSRVKDRLEDWMAASLRHTLTDQGHDAATALLKAYQHEIATDWIAAYKKYISAHP